MVGLNGVILSETCKECLGSLKNCDWISFAKISQTMKSEGIEIFVWLSLGFMIIFMKNLNGYIERKKMLQYYHAIIISAIFLLYYFTTIELKQSPFLYFNF